MVIECTIIATILLCTCSDVEMALCPVRLSRYVRLMMASFRGMWEMRMSPDFVSTIIATLSISLSIHIHCTYYSYITTLTYETYMYIYCSYYSYSPGFITLV